MKLRVTNVPVRTFAEVVVEVPDSKDPEAVQDAIEKALDELQDNDKLENVDLNAVEVDSNLLMEWNFHWKPVK